MAFPARSYSNQGRGSRRERVMHEVHNVEDRIPLLHKGDAIAIRAKSLCGKFKVNIIR